MVSAKSKEHQSNKEYYRTVNFAIGGLVQSALERKLRSSYWSRLYHPIKRQCVTVHWLAGWPSLPSPSLPFVSLPHPDGSGFSFFV